jgi:hypothetical protein
MMDDEKLAFTAGSRSFDARSARHVLRKRAESPRE